MRIRGIKSEFYDKLLPGEKAFILDVFWISAVLIALIVWALLV